MSFLFPLYENWEAKLLTPILLMINWEVGKRTLDENREAKPTLNEKLQAKQSPSKLKIAGQIANYKLGGQICQYIKH